ncbi:Endonuclease/exonuclease/phosphatase, partial [Trema orientale]
MGIWSGPTVIGSKPTPKLGIVFPRMLISLIGQTRPSPRISTWVFSHYPKLPEDLSEEKHHRVHGWPDPRRVPLKKWVKASSFSVKQNTQTPLPRLPTITGKEISISSTSDHTVNLKLPCPSSDILLLTLPPISNSPISESSSTQSGPPSTGPILQTSSPLSKTSKAQSTTSVQPLGPNSSCPSSIPPKKRKVMDSSPSGPRPFKNPRTSNHNTESLQSVCSSDSPNLHQNLLLLPTTSSNLPTTTSVLVVALTHNTTTQQVLLDIPLNFHLGWHSSPLPLPSMRTNFPSFRASSWRARARTRISRSHHNGAMILLSWNCRGLGHTSTVLELKALVQSLCPDCIFLAETKNRPEVFERYLRRWYFYNIISIPPTGVA